MNGLDSLLHEFGLWSVVAVAVAALVTSSIQGAVGVAGGFLMTAALAWTMGVRLAVPVMSVALIISHLSRSLLNFHAIDRTALLAVMVTAVPMIAVGAFLYGALPVPMVALVLGIIILSSIPLRHWARARAIKAGKTTLSTVGTVYGFLAGGSVGSGMLLAPFMLGYGLGKEAFVGTMAVIALSTNVTRIVVFGSTRLLDGHHLLIGVLLGLLMIPGNWIGRTALRRMAPGTHSRLIDVFAVIGAVNFFYLAATR